MTFFLRTMDKKDIQEVATLHDALFPLKYSYNIFLEFCTPDYVSLLLIYKEDDSERIIGVATANREWVSQFSRARNGYLCTFGIHPEFRRQHLGTYLLTAISSILFHHYHCINLNLHTLKSNERAIKFYEANGFTIKKFLPNYYSIRNANNDAVFLSCELKKCNMDLRPDIVTSNDVVDYLNTEDSVSWFRRFCMTP